MFAACAGALTPGISECAAGSTGLCYRRGAASGKLYLFRGIAREGRTLGLC